MVAKRRNARVHIPIVRVKEPHLVEVNPESGPTAPCSIIIFRFGT